MKQRRRHHNVCHLFRARTPLYLNSKSGLRSNDAIVPYEDNNDTNVDSRLSNNDSDQLHVKRCDDNNAYIGNPNGGVRCDILGSSSAIISDKANSTQSVSATCEQNKGIVGKGVRRRGHRRKDVVKMGQVDGVRKIEKVIKNNNSQSRRLQRYT